MKVSDLQIDVSAEVSKKTLKKIKKMLVRKKKEIDSCKKTLRLMEDSYNDLIETDINDLELDDYEY